MLNLFGRTFRHPVQYPPAFPALPIPGCRFAHSAAARVFAHPLHQLHYARNEDLYTAEEEAELSAFLDRDLPGDPTGEGNVPTRVPDGGSLSPKHPHPSEYRRVKKLVRSDESPAETPILPAESTQPSVDVPTIDSWTTPPPSSSTPEDEGSEWEYINEDSVSRPIKHLKPPTKKKPRPKSVSKPKGKPDPILSLETLKLPPKPSYEPYKHLLRFPYMAITLAVDPLGAPPSINSLFFSMGFRYRSQTLYRRRSAKLRLALRRVWKFVSIEYLTEEEAGKRRAEKRESLAREYEARLRAQMAYHMKRSQGGTAADGEG
ncbi:hypothetical protein M407DRAFT_178881 [Tulasnella calospora MUT 4182]|uniref:Uncharacterized protein n=1 Tax=Tulasnella calospora MUT 4182 TaxID=1051891 RepID=A0A0C3QCZ0_9AGAM|nr:hypothetical protein M407DRAFT_178881 [Tulasnella calospora MUT 4182]